jgi:predicted nucleic acid-binding protein
MTYLLDANVFIQAKNLHYGLDFCPAFWDWLVEANAAGKVFSVEKVRDELEAGADELADWAARRGSGFFLRPDAAVLPALARVSSWVMAQGYEPAAVSMFLQIADYYLVAHALAHGYVVVTHEKPSSSWRTIKIPDVCIGLGMKCMTPFEMLRLERARFVLGSRVDGQNAGMQQLTLEPPENSV